MLLFRHSMRYLSRHPLMVGLAVVGVAVGVAVVVAIDVANSSARKAFELSSESVTGRSTHSILSGQDLLDEDIYARLRLEGPIRTISPVVEGYLRIRDCDNRVYQVLGVDPIVDAPVRSLVRRESIDLGGLISGPSMLMEASAAGVCHLKVGDSTDVDVEGRAGVLRLAGTLQPEDERSRTALEGLVIVDISTAQELFDVVGSLTRIDLVVDRESEHDRLAELVAWLPAGVVLQRSSKRTETVAQMTRAFDVNLRALSLLALVVGMFLIYNTMTFSVVQRRRLIGRLRAMGVTRREVLGMVLTESALVGVFGTALGVVVGIALASVLVELVTQTINDLYYVLNVQRLSVSGWSIVKGVALGIGATVLSSLRPAWEATSVPVTVALSRSSVESASHRLAGRLALLALIVAALAALTLKISSHTISLSYVGMLFVIVAFVFATPWIVLGASRALRGPAGWLFGIIGRMAAHAIGTSLSRTGVAIAALMVAVAATIGVSVMVTSFRVTVEQWLGYSLQADVYVQPPNLVLRRGDAAVDPGAVDAIRRVDGVAESYTVAQSTLLTEHGSIDFVIIDPSPRTPEAFRLKKGSRTAWPDFESGRGVLVSEPLSYRHALAVGDSIAVLGGSEAVRLRISGIYYDYGSDLGSVLLSRKAYQKHFSDPGVNGIALYLEDGADGVLVINAIRAATGSMQDLIVRSNRDLRSASLEIFDRTFVVTGVLRLLAIAVAFVGVLSSLLALQLEKTKELAVLRANGMTPRQVWSFVTIQTGAMGLIAGILSLPLGLSLAALLTFVINRRSFGWTLAFEPTMPALIGAVFLSVGAALLAGLYPSWRMAKMQASVALAQETN